MGVDETRGEHLPGASMTRVAFHDDSTSAHGPTFTMTPSCTAIPASSSTPDSAPRSRMRAPVISRSHEDCLVDDMASIPSGWQNDGADSTIAGRAQQRRRGRGSERRTFNGAVGSAEVDVGDKPWSSQMRMSPFPRRGAPTKVVNEIG